MRSHPAGMPANEKAVRAIKVRLKQELEVAQSLFFGPIHGGAADGPSEDKQLAVKEERSSR